MKLKTHEFKLLSDKTSERKLWAKNGIGNSITKQLVNRGKIHFWVNTEVIKNWKAPKQKKNGHPFLYSDCLIQIICYTRFKFRMSLRESEGFFASLVALLKKDLPIPCYTQICRRMKILPLPKYLLE